MSKLQPMLKNDATDAEKWLLRSAQLDVPPASGKRRALAALGLAAAATTTAGASGVAAAATAGGGWVIKCIAVGAIGGVVVAGAVEGVSALVPESAPHALAPALTTSTMAVSHPSEPRAPVTLPVEPSFTDPTDPARPLERATDVPDPTVPMPPPPQTTQRAPAVAARVEPSPAPSPDQHLRPTETTLAQEVSALDEARRALASGDAETALRALDAYELRVAAPRLGPEATVLRVEALLFSKQFDRARLLGEQLLAKDPDGAYAQHVRSLLTDTAR